MTEHYHTLYHCKPLRVRRVDGLTLAWIDSEESASGFYDEIQSVNNDTWRYRYDGQRCFEEDLTKITGAPGNPVVTITGTRTPSARGGSTCCGLSR